MWANGEEERVRKAAMYYKKGSGNMGPEPKPENAGGSQPKRDGTTPNSAPCERLWGFVVFVHQTYGFYRDGKAKSEVFEESTRRWKQVAINMGAWYHEWAPSQLETLIRKKYPQYWQMYMNCRYPVMRVDIGRIIILHCFGGLYSDMDVWPNRAEYARRPFAVCYVPAGLAAKEHEFF